MALQLPFYYEEETNFLKSILDAVEYIEESRYNTTFRNTYIKRYFKISSIREIQQNNSILSLDLQIIYLKNNIFENDSKEEEITRNLMILNPSADTLMRNNSFFTQKLWEDDYPTTIAIDTKTKELFFLHIYFSNTLKLTYFATLSEDEFDSIEYDLMDSAAFKFNICNEALFLYISNDEGLRYLKENLYIQINCGGVLIPITHSICDFETS